MEYGKILVPYDALQMSDKALERAAEIAKTARSVIFIIHVIPQIPISSREISNIHTSNNGEITLYTKEVYNKMGLDIISIIDKKRRNTQINKSSSNQR